MKWIILALCAICSFLFLYNLESRDFWAPDEGDFAEIATEMHNDLVVPHLNNVPYGEKPPLFYYMTYGSHRLFAFFRDETSMRIPTALAAIALALYFFVTVGGFAGKKEAILGTAILISAPLYYWQARYLQVDMIFAVFVACSMLSFFRFYEQGAKGFCYAFFICAALAFMTKGPVSIVLIFPSVFIYLLLRRDFSLLKRKETYAGLLILAVLIIPWYVAVYCKEGFPYLYENIIRQNFLRFFEAWSHKRPFYYYLTTLPLDFFPWSLFLPLGTYLCLARRNYRSKTAFFLIWSAWMFFFLSLSSGKISKYMLPLLPALSVIVSHAFLEERSTYRSGMFAFLAAAFLVLGCFLFFYRFGGYPQFRPERAVLGVLSLALTASLILCLRRRDSIRAFGAVFLFMILVYGVANISIAGKWNPYKSPRAVAERIKPYVKDGTPWIYYGSMRGTYVYYVGAYAVHVDEHDTARMSALGKELKRFFILTRKRDMEEVTHALPGTRSVFEERIGDTVMVFAGYDRSDVP